MCSQVNEKCDRILQHLPSGLIQAVHHDSDSAAAITQPPVPSNAPIRHKVVAPVFPPLVPQAPLLRFWLPLHKCWTCGPGLKARALWWTIWGSILAIIMLIVLLVTLLPNLQSSPAIQFASVVPVSILTTPTSAGSAMLEFTVATDRAADIFYAVLPAASGAPAADDVITVATADRAIALSDLSVACGSVRVPQSNQNFTFSISSTTSQTECQDVEARIRALSDPWARAQKCSRCPTLASRTDYQVRLTNSKGCLAVSLLVF